MRSKTTVWYTLGEAEKGTGIPRTRLDHACRVGRLPYRRTEAGARLLSHDVVEKLRKDGLKSFPRPYYPIASSNGMFIGSWPIYSQKLDALQPEQLTKRLIQAAIDKALQPWHKRKEIEKVIEETRN